MNSKAINLNIRAVGKLAVIALIITTVACNAMSYFDAWSYKETISAKVEALDLMEKAVNNYSAHEDDVNDVMLKMKKIFEYEKNRKNNFETWKMWEILLNEEGNLFGGFINRWREQNQMSHVLINEMKIQVTEAFDLILDLENNKIKKSEVQSFINSN